MSTYLVYYNAFYDRPAAWFGTGWTREQLVRDLLGGQLEFPTRIIEINPDEKWGGGHSSMGVGWTRDVSTEIARAVVREAMADERRIPDCIRNFIDAHYRAEWMVA